MMRVTMLPAEDGDCLLVEYGDDSFVRRILVDGGRASTYPQIRPMLADLGFIDLLVVTHVDQDHILGVLELFEDPACPVRFGDVWFNGYDELLDTGMEKFGAQDGEKLTSALLAQEVPWNVAFGGRGVEVGRVPTWPADGSSLTVLSPDRAQLEKLAPVWVRECAKHGLIPGRDPSPPVPGFESFGPVAVDTLADLPLEPDTSATNRSSIGLLLEYDGKRLVLTGDADDRRLVASLRSHAEAEGGRLRIDALKVAHHGSDRNLSADLLSILDCPRYLISTSGARHDHPNDTAMSRILGHGGATKELAFNYRAPSGRWDAEALRTKYGYTVLAPAASADGFLTVEL